MKKNRASMMAAIGLMSAAMGAPEIEIAPIGLNDPRMKFVKIASSKEGQPGGAARNKKSKRKAQKLARKRNRK